VNYNQLPVNTPIVPVANFQRDGPMAFNNQGARPNYQSSITPLTYLNNKGSAHGAPRDQEREATHENWLGGAFWDLTEVTERMWLNSMGFGHTDKFLVDFEQPRALYQNVMSDTDRAHLVSNLAGHIGGVKSAEVRARTRMFNPISGYFPAEANIHLVSYFASVDQSLSDRIAKAIGAPTAKPLAVKPAAEALRFRHGIGAAAQRL
jgi:catalase